MFRERIFILGLKLKVLGMKIECVLEFIILSGKPVSEKFLFQTTYLHKCTVKTMGFYNASHQVGDALQKELL